MPTLNNGSVYGGSYNINQSGDVTFTFTCKDNYVDKNIALTVSTPAVTPVFDGGTLTASSSAVGINAVLSSTDTSGVQIQTKYTASRDAVLYNGEVNGWVNKTDNTQALASANISETNGATYYLTGVTLGLGKSFDISVPNNNNTDYITFRFIVDSLGNTTVVNTD